MTPDERLALIRVKIERARKHIRDLDAEVNFFFNQQPYKVGVKRNPQTRQLVYYLLSVLEPPPTIAAITGDVLQNLRSSLDHLAYHLAVIGTGNMGSFRHVYFPIADDAAKYEDEKKRKVKGMRQDAVKAIDAIKPYRGGNDTLWRLHKLNNVDKHRLLITVGSAFRSVNIGSIMQQFMEQIGNEGKFNNTDKLPRLDLFIKPADRMFPLKEGDELFISMSDAEVDDQLQFQFEITLSEPQVIEGEHLLATLQQMIDLVDNIIVSFKPLLI